MGYQYKSGTIIRVDSQLIHSEIVRPTLSMLSDPMYEGANAEFLSAHEHYRTRQYKECLNDSLKAFESTIKAICTQRDWKFNSCDTAKRLIEIIFEQGLIPVFMQTHFASLRSALGSFSHGVEQRSVGVTGLARRATTSAQPDPDLEKCGSWYVYRLQDSDGQCF